MLLLRNVTAERTFDKKLLPLTHHVSGTWNDRNPLPAAPCKPTALNSALAALGTVFFVQSGCVWQLFKKLSENMAQAGQYKLTYIYARLWLHIWVKKRIFLRRATGQFAGQSWIEWEKNLHRTEADGNSTTSNTPTWELLFKRKKIATIPFWQVTPPESTWGNERRFGAAHTSSNLCAEAGGNLQPSGRQSLLLYCRIKPAWARSRSVFE